jgi:hypothetical protein
MGHSVSTSSRVHMATFQQAGELAASWISSAWARLQCSIGMVLRDLAQTHAQAIDNAHKRIHPAVIRSPFTQLEQGQATGRGDQADPHRGARGLPSRAQAEAQEPHP